MSDGDPRANPYSLIGDNALSLAPFAGRKAAIARMHTQLSDPANDAAVAFIGTRHSGKTALLRHFPHFFDETYVGVYLPLATTPIPNETEWLLALAQAATAEVVERGFGVSRLSHLQPPGDDPRAWFDQTFLPEMLLIVRPHRRLIYLLDDIDYLFDAIDSERLPPDSIAYLHNLLKRHRQLDMVLTLDASREKYVHRLTPFVRLTEIHRLSRLTLEDSAWYLREPVAGLYSVPDETVQAVYRATGGLPVLLNLMADALYRRWEANPDLNVLTVDDVKLLTPRVAERAHPLFRELWTTRSPNDHLILTAISRLAYEDPLSPITPAAIESWLIDSDYPLDITTINSALRSLEYDEIVTLASPSGIMINAGLFQSWLLENAQSVAIAAGGDAAARSDPTRRLWLLVAVALALVLGVVILVSLSNAPEPGIQADIAPTVTLAGSR